ncbi:hypothetical protein LJK88_09450 [Paenibacillus sp. P26]|nr:hypothetical protein LJK88_09450 [Paenibacillus sp. P26]
MSEFTIQSLEGTVVRGSRNRLDETNDPSIQGAYATVETFYHAFNNRSLALFNQIWLPHPLIQLNNPLGGIVRGLKLWKRCTAGSFKAGFGWKWNFMISFYMPLRSTPYLRAGRGGLIRPAIK